MSRQVFPLEAVHLIPWVTGCRICTVLHNESVPAPPREQRPERELRTAIDEHFSADHDIVLVGYGHNDGAHWVPRQEGD